MTTTDTRPTLSQVTPEELIVFCAAIDRLFAQLKREQEAAGHE